MATGIAHRVTVVSGAAFAFVLSASPLRAQSGLEEAIEQYGATAVRGYIQPLADVLVANLSIGFINSASAPGRFSLGIEAVGMAAAIKDGFRTYIVNTPPGFQPATHETATIFGGAATPVQHSTIPGLTWQGADGVYGGDYFPAAAPQLRVGGLFGTELVVRYASSAMVPSLDEEDFPDLTLFGVGVQHSLNRYFLLLPVDLTVSASFNSLKFGDIVDLSANSIGVNVGRSFGLFGVSGGLISDGGTMNVRYTSTDPVAPGSVDIDLDVDRTIRFRAGASVSLGFLRVFGDAAFGDVISYAGGLRFGF